MPCTTILVGKKASYDGSTMIARNDDSGAGHYTSKKFVVIHPEEQPRTYKTEISHLTIELPDNAHAVHPNHPEKADPTNRPYLNGGIVIKFHGSQKYTTDGISAAKMKDYCERAKVPYQTYANRSDIAGGSTLGNISTAHVSVSSVDIGLPQLAMHSAVETAGMMDTEYAVRALKEFWGE